VTDIYTKLDSYGVNYEGEQGDYQAPDLDYDVTLSELAARGGKIVRVRWIGGDYIPGRGKCYDLSYVHGEIDGQRVRINLQGCDEWGLIPRRQLKAAMIAWAKNEGVYAKGIGLLDNYSILG
jgi:hypothetical protein